MIDFARIDHWAASGSGLLHRASTVSKVVLLLLVVSAAVISRNPYPLVTGYGLLLAVAAAIPLVLVLSNFAPLSNRLDEQSQLAGLTIQTDSALGFLWNIRSWDLLLVVILVAATMLGVMNMFSRGGAVEK